jgi:uncharacterized protein
VTAFFDPSVEFGVKFEVADVDSAEDGETESRLPIRPLPRGASAAEPADKPAVKAVSKKPGKTKVAASDVAQNDPAEAPSVENAPAEGEKIVSLDHFRKKK